MRGAATRAFGLAKRAAAALSTVAARDCCAVVELDASAGSTGVAGAGLSRTLSMLGKPDVVGGMLKAAGARHTAVEAVVALEAAGKCLDAADSAAGFVDSFGCTVCTHLACAW